MSFRIDVQTEAGKCMIRFDGVLDIEASEELQKILSMSVDGQGNVLDLAGTSYVDGAGVAFLRSVERNGVELTGASGLVRQLLLSAEQRGGSGENQTTGG